MNSFTHLDESGQVRMVDVADKPETLRQATAACRVVVGPKVFPLLLAGRLPKGDVWAAARLAGIMAAELGLDVHLARRGGLLHDIGKVLSHQQDGTHVQLGVEVAKKYGEHEIVINCSAAHHDDVPHETPISMVGQAADAVSGSRPGARREAFEVLARLAGPMMPHLAEALWQRLGCDGLLADAPWPAAEQALLVEDTVNVAVQVMGKLRATIAMPRDAAQAAAEKAAMDEPGVLAAIGDKAVRRIIFVPNRIINFVIG